MLAKFDLRRWRPELVILIVAAFATRLWQLFTPNAVVFDEVYFKVFAGHYLDHKYFFDIHPPLGKLLLAGWAHLLGLSTDTVLNTSAVSMRLLPAIAGALLIPVFWGILRRLGASRPFAAMGAAALLLDNALLVESRFILIDSMLLLFGLSALYFYLVARDAHGTHRRWPLLMVAAILAGAAASTKWTGLTALALVGLLWLADHRGHSFRWRRSLGELAILVIMPVAVYMSSFAVHFHLLSHSGDGDAFMSLPFQQTLVGSPYYNPDTHLSFWDKFIQLNQEMYKANQTLTATHPYGSRWYTWPMELRPIYYWEGGVNDNGTQGNIYLLGNPVVWWGVLAALLAGTIYLRVRRLKLRPATVSALALAAGAYIMNFAPFIGVPRVMFLYHYLFSFIFSIAFVVLLWNDLLPATQRRRAAFWVIGALALGFLFFAPLSYGTPLSPAGLQLHMWLPSWR